MSASLVWATTDIDQRIAYMARVSNLSAKPDDPHEKLINYLIAHRHWSPLEMANICVQVVTTRDIARQVLRHRSLHFQEFSQRYAEVDQDKPITSLARLQDHKNRQNSIPTDDYLTNDTWQYHQDKVWKAAVFNYRAALKMGIAKELARKLLPEGLTRTSMYINGSVRDWFHYLEVRLDPSTQLEHRVLAEEIHAVCKQAAPTTFGLIKTA